MQFTHVHKHTSALYQMPTCTHARTHKYTNAQSGSRVNPVDKEILQLCIKEDTEASNYSNCASCHNSNMAVHMLYSINQETATCLLPHTIVWWPVKIIYHDKISHIPKAKNRCVYCKQQIPLECIECIYLFIYFQNCTVRVICWHQVAECDSWNLVNLTWTLKCSL